MPDARGPASEFDEAWKMAIQTFLQPCLHLCFRAVHDLVDWRHPPEFLDTELQKIAPDHEQGGRAVDKLIKLRLLDGREAWVLVHIDIQAQRVAQFALRMWF